MFVSTCFRCGAPLPYPYRYCPQCGATQPISPPEPPSHLAPAAYPQAPGGASDKRVVIVVLSIVLLGLGSGVLVYFLLQGIIQAPLRPAVTFGAPFFIGSAVQIPLDSVTAVVGPSNYRVNLGIGGSFGSPVPMPTYGGSFVYIGIDGTTYGVSWIDANAGVYVDAGDSFVLQVISGFPPCPAALTSFYLVWQDGTTLASVSFDWSCASPPVVVFATPVATAGREIITVANASRALAPSEYDVGLEVNVTTGVTLAMPTASGSTVALSVYGYPYDFTLTWTDFGGDGTVNGGDSFTVGYAGGALPANTSYTFSLLWQRVNLVANTTWFTT